MSLLFLQNFGLPKVVAGLASKLFLKSAYERVLKVIPVPLPPPIFLPHKRRIEK